MDASTRNRLIRDHRSAIEELESSQGSNGQGGEAQSPPEFYLLWHVLIGMMLGAIAALVSLLVNLLGAPLFNEDAFQLIRIYLTFPMGAEALQAERGLVLFVGCVLYLLTGALYGLIFHLLWEIFLRRLSRMRQFLVAVLAGLGLWVVNFYLILSWLQPLLLGGNWIVDLVPIWVGALTHLAFTGSLAVCEIWGDFTPSS